MRKIIDVPETSRHLKQLCDDKGIRATDIMKELDLTSVQAVYKWYSPKCRSLPSLDHMVLLSRLLGCSIEEMLVLKEMQDN